MAAQEITELEQLISSARETYYSGNPEMSDAEFDALVARLRVLDPTSPVLSKVGTPASGPFEKVIHHIPMLSLDKVTTIQELSVWQNKVRDYSYVVMHKIDGASLSLQYENGLLVRAVTRGDGTKGDDITANAKMIKSIPQILPEPMTIEVRGEVVCYKSTFNQVNVDGKYANPRNFAAGSMRQSDPKVVRQRQLDFMAYLLVGNVEGHEYMENDLELLRVLGFTVVDYTIIQWRNLAEYVGSKDASVGQWRDQLDYEIDGLVIKPDTLDVQRQYSNDFRTADHAIAFKFPPEIGTTILTDVRWTVGKTGIATPTGIFEPIKIGGVVITHVNLCNLDEIARLGIQIGDKVNIERRGDVIPKVASAFRGIGRTPISVPAECPDCGTNLVRDGAYLICPNRQGCPAQKAGMILYCKDLLDILYIGEAAVTALIEQGVINDFADLFTVTVNQLASVMGETMAKKVYGQIHSHETITLAQFFPLLGIYGVGRTVGRIIADKWPTLNEFLQVTRGELVSTPGIGNVLGNRMADWFHAKSNVEYAGKLRDVLKIKEPPEQVGNKLSGQTVVITGTLSKPRKEFEDVIASNGGKIGSSISSTTTFLLAGEGGGSKRQKATQLGVQVISEQEFWELLG